MSEMTPARQPNPASIIRRECAERIATYTALLEDDLMQRAETGTMTEDDFDLLDDTLRIGKSMWSGMNASAARFIAEHGGKG
jgi:hypothetical protein